MAVPPVYSHTRSHMHDKDPLVHVRVQWIECVEEQNVNSYKASIQQSPNIQPCTTSIQQSPNIQPCTTSIQLTKHPANYNIHSTATKHPAKYNIHSIVTQHPAMYNASIKQSPNIQPCTNASIQQSPHIQPCKTSIQQSPNIQPCTTPPFHSHPTSSQVHSTVTKHPFNSHQPFSHVQCIHSAVTKHPAMYNTSIQQSPNTQQVQHIQSTGTTNLVNSQSSTTHPDKCNNPVIIPPCGFLQTRQSFLGIFSSDTKCSTRLTCEKLRLTTGD